MTRRDPHAAAREACPNRANHTEGPRGYTQWWHWAEQMQHAHIQEQCPGCGYWLIVKPKETPMTETMTIGAGTAADLYEGENGDTAYGWTRVADVRDSSGRWMEHRTLIVADANGVSWGVRYDVGLTEEQEHELPWDGGAESLELVRLYPHTVTKTVYRTEPPAATAEAAR